MSADRRRRILALALPIIGGMVSQNVLNLVDTAMVGSLGAPALAAVGVASILFFISSALITGISSAVQALASRRVGEGQPEEAAEGLWGGVALSLAAGVPGAALLYAVAPALLELMVDDPAVLADAVPYYRVRLAALVSVGINFAFRGFWNGVDRPGLYLRTLLIMHVSNVILSYVLIFGVAGAPELGCLGAGVGTAAATWLGTAAYFVLAATQGRPFGVHRLRVPIERAATLVRLAIPAALQQWLFAMAFGALFSIIARIGTDELAAASVLLNLNLVGVLPALGLGLAATTLVGQALGRGDPADAARWAWDVVRVAVGILALVALPFLAVPELVLGVFLPDDPAAVAVAVTPLRLGGVGLLADAMGMVLMQALLGAGAARTVMAVSVGTQWGLYLPLAWVVGPWMGGGLTAVWSVQLGQRLLQAGLFAGVWVGGRWATIKV
jgi:MATE family multidrug resistance protein